MDSKKIDLINIGLIILSLVIAIKLPFKLFLFVYAILGPLHYLTEINWLDKKNYFMTAKRNWVLPFIFFALVISAKPLFDLFTLNNGAPNNFINFLLQQANTMVLAAFVFAISLLFLKKSFHVLFGLIGSVLLAYTLNHYVSEAVIFAGIFLPTIIHIYVFTLLFILYGAIRGKSKFGIYNAIVLLTVPFIIYFISIDPNNYSLAPKTSTSYMDSTIGNVAAMIGKFLGGVENGKFYALSEVAIKIQIFIAFAYTYHYLNWFSKTSVIGWKNSLTKKRSIIILGIWLVSVGLYLYDFKTGFTALFLLSFLHVTMEFPLNAVTIKGLLNPKKLRG